MSNFNNGMALKSKFTRAAVLGAAATVGLQYGDLRADEGMGMPLGGVVGLKLSARPSPSVASTGIWRRISFGSIRKSGKSKSDTRQAAEAKSLEQKLQKQLIENQNEVKEAKLYLKGLNLQDQTARESIVSELLSAKERHYCKSGTALYGKEVSITGEVTYVYKTQSEIARDEPEFSKWGELEKNILILNRSVKKEIRQKNITGLRIPDLDLKVFLCYASLSEDGERESSLIILLKYINDIVEEGESKFLQSIFSDEGDDLSLLD